MIELVVLVAEDEVEPKLGRPVEVLAGGNLVGARLADSRRLPDGVSALAAALLTRGPRPAPGPSKDEGLVPELIER